MSRIGRKPISIPDNVSVEVTNSQVVVKGPKGELKAPVLDRLSVGVKDGQVWVSRQDEDKHTRSCHGLQRSLINNHVLGVSQGFEKTLKLVGTGYRVKQQGQGLSLTLGFSHPVIIEPVEGIEFKVEGNDTIQVLGIDKQLVGQTSANIRSKRPPEPYKGKGIRYLGEVVRRKVGKAAAWGKMAKTNYYQNQRQKRRQRVRAKLKGTKHRPRLNVFRSNKHVYAQVINDDRGQVVAASNELMIKKATQKLLSGSKTQRSQLVAEDLAKKIKQRKITRLCFDRGQYKFHGRVKQIAEVIKKHGVQL